MSERRLPYRLESERLVLRPWELSDTPALHALVVANREHLVPWMSWAREELTLDGYLEFAQGRRAAFDRGEDFGYVLCDLDQGTPVGAAGLHTRCGAGGLEVGYWIAEDRCGQGLATEAAAVLTRVAFDHGRVQRVELRAEEGNVASLRVAEKLGFLREGTLRRRIQMGESWVDVVSYSLVLEEAHEGPVNAYSYRAYDALGRPVEAS